MKPNATCAGECMLDTFRLHYNVVSLEFIKDKSLTIEAICYNPFDPVNREAIFKHTTNNLSSKDDKQVIAISILNSFIESLELSRDNLYKLVVRNKEVFFIKLAD